MSTDYKPFASIVAKRTEHIVSELIQTKWGLSENTQMNMPCGRLCGQGKYQRNADQCCIIWLYCTAANVAHLALPFIDPLAQARREDQEIKEILIGDNV